MPKTTDLQSTEALLNELQDLQNEIQTKKQAGGKKAKKSSKKASKKGSKKSSKKGSKKGSKKSKMSRMVMMGVEDEMMGGKRRSKKGSKKASKGSKKGSKKGSMTGGKRTLNPALKATQVVNEKILKESGAERKHWFGLITYVNTLRKDAKKQVKDEKDFEAVNKKIMELFDGELDKKGKAKIAKTIEDYYTEAMAKRGKRGSKK